MSRQTTSVSIKGHVVEIPCIRVGEAEIYTVSRGYFKEAVIKDEEYAEDIDLGNPRELAHRLRRDGIQADIFSLTDRTTTARDALQAIAREADNEAAIVFETYDAWLKELSQSARRNVRLAGKKGVEVKEVEYDLDFAKGIKGIYDESPVRQGRAFWHYQKPIEKVFAENGTFPERSINIGAYLDDELIGFMKMVIVGKAASIIQVLSKERHLEKRPSVAMIAKAVEVCEGRGLNKVIYCKYSYGKKTNESLVEFKRRLGFEQIDYNRYFIPMTPWGRLIIALRLHRGIKSLLPPSFVDFLRNLRTRYYERKNKNLAE